MRLVEKNEKGFSFQLADRDRLLLLRMLELYPRVPPAHKRVSQAFSSNSAKEAQQLLDEALNDERKRNAEMARELITVGERLRLENHRWLLKVSNEEVEMLLQVLNDVRIGSWLLLGEPKGKVPIDTLNEEGLSNLAAMEVAGYFQMQLLEAIGPS